MDNQPPSLNQSHLEVEDKALNSKHHNKNRGPRRQGGGGGGGGQSREVIVSKALSKLLRHQAANAGIALSPEGYAPVEAVLAYNPIKSLGVKLSEIQEIVRSNDKQRFSLKLKDEAGAAAAGGGDPDSATEAGDWLIRANQGHSIKIESEALLEPLTVEAGNIPPRVLHGTYYAFWPKIVEAGGLKVMGRNHVHCSTGTPEDGVKSGMRRDAELLIEIDVERSIREGGLKWWRSDNDVVLTEGDGDGLVNTRFFKLVTGRSAEVGTLWEEGEWAADLPQGLKIRVPQGKGSRGGGARRGRGGGRP